MREATGREGVSRGRNGVRRVVGNCPVGVPVGVPVRTVAGAQKWHDFELVVKGETFAKGLFSQDLRHRICRGFFDRSRSTVEAWRGFFFFGIPFTRHGFGVWVVVEYYSIKVFFTDSISNQQSGLSDYIHLSLIKQKVMSGFAEAFTETDEAIKHLLRRVVYMFYPHQSIIIMEALLFHNVLFEDDLIKLCCMHKKVFRSFCNKLIEDKLIVAHTQKEETQPFKLFSRTYYYIHNIEAIDSIKWKIHLIVKKVKEEIGNFSEPQGYICPTCHTKYSLLDAASLLTDDRMNFECSICNDYLIDDDISHEQKKGQEKLENLMSLLEPIIHYLKIVDDLEIEDNNFETTLMKYVPAFSDSLAIYSVSNKTSQSRKNKKDNDINEANKKSQATIHVSITADDEDLKRERQKREDRNKKLRQNALPSWHQESTVYKQALGRLDNDDLPDNEIGSGTFSTDQTPDPENMTSPSMKTEDGQIASPAQISTVPTSASSENTNIMKESIIKSEPSDDKSSNPATINHANTLTNVSIPQNIGDGTSAEEFDALSAYYTQLRQRQADEEQEEQDEELDDEIELDDEFNDNEDEENVVNHTQDGSTPNPSVSVETSISPQPKAQPEPEESKSKSAAGTEDIDEDDFDLDMFESDNE